MIGHFNDLAAAWWSWMFPMLWQTTLLAGFVWTLDLLLRRRGWPQVRYALWLLVFARLLVPPSFALPTSLSARLIAASGPGVSTAQSLAPAVVAPVESSPAAAAPAPVQPAARAPITLAPASPALSGKAWAMLASAGVSALLFVWLGVKLLRLRRLATRGSQREPVPAWIEERLARLAAQFHLRRLPRIAVTGEVPSAAVCGVFRPILFLPESSLALPPEQLEHVLLHELAHLKRRDLLINAAQSVLHIIYWFNPVLWFAGRQLRHLREICCDATVGNLLRERTGEYSRTLIELADRALNLNVGQALGLLGLFESPSRLRQRIEYLRRPVWKYRRLRWIAAAGAAAAVVLCIVPMAVVKAAPPETPKAPAGGSTAEPQVQRREVNKLVSAFPPEVDLSTPESACAAFHRAIGHRDEKAMLSESWVQWDPDSAERILKEMDQDKVAITNKAYLDAEIIEVLTYRNDVAAVISRLDFPPSAEGTTRVEPFAVNFAAPFSTRFFGCIDGKWKNLGEHGCASLDDERNNFEKNKDNMWAHFEGFRKASGGAPAPQTFKGESREPVVDRSKAELMGRVEDFFAHNYRDISARETIEWGDVTTDNKGNRSIRYKYLPTIRDKDKMIVNEVYTFDAQGKFVSVKKVEGFPQKYSPEPVDTSTQAGLIKLVEKFFSQNFRDITARETVEWGSREVLPNGNLSIRYKYNATIRDKDHLVMNQVFVFDPKGEYVLLQERRGIPQGRSDCICAKTISAGAVGTSGAVQGDLDRCWSGLTCTAPLFSQDRAASRTAGYNISRRGVGKGDNHECSKNPILRVGAGGAAPDWRLRGRQREPDGSRGRKDRRGANGKGHFCGRMLLVHAAAVREAQGRFAGAGRLHRRHGREPDV